MCVCPLLIEEPNQTKGWVPFGSLPHKKAYKKTPGVPSDSRKEGHLARLQPCCPVFLFLGWVCFKIHHWRSGAGCVRICHICCIKRIVLRTPTNFPVAKGSFCLNVHLLRVRNVLKEGTSIQWTNLADFLVVQTQLRRV